MEILKWAEGTVLELGRGGAQESKDLRGDFALQTCRTFTAQPKLSVARLILALRTNRDFPIRGEK